jgi:hypothetical protein
VSLALPQNLYLGKDEIRNIEVLMVANLFTYGNTGGISLSPSVVIYFYLIVVQAGTFCKIVYGNKAFAACRIPLHTQKIVWPVSESKRCI